MSGSSCSSKSGSKAGSKAGSKDRSRSRRRNEKKGNKKGASINIVRDTNAAAKEASSGAESEAKASPEKEEQPGAHVAFMLKNSLPQDVWNWAVEKPSEYTRQKLLKWYMAEMKEDAIKWFHNLGIMSDKSKKYYLENLVAEKHLQFDSGLPNEKMEKGFIADAKVSMCLRWMQSVFDQKNAPALEKQKELAYVVSCIVTEREVKRNYSAFKKALKTSLRRCGVYKVAELRTLLKPFCMTIVPTDGDGSSDSDSSA
eukprot:g19202.t1